MNRTTQWQKATASDANGNCVELRRNGQSIEVRDSKNREGAVLTFTPGEMTALLDGVRKHEFDHLLDD